MAVALRGSTQGTYQSGGAHSIAWPAGTAAGDWGFVFTVPSESGKPKAILPADWKLFYVKSGSSISLWGKQLTAADIASPLLVVASVAMLQVFSGCGGVGTVGTVEAVTAPAGGGALVLGFKAKTSLEMTPLVGKLHPADIVHNGWDKRRYNTWWKAAAAAGTVKVGTNATWFVSAPLLPIQAPTPPTLLAPADGAAVSPSSPITFSWRHNHPTGAPQTRHNLRIREVGTTAWLWLRGDGLLYSTSGSVASSASSRTMQAGQLTAGTTYEWQMQTAVDDGSGNPLWTPTWGPPTFLLTATTPPVVNTVTVSAPVGDLTPTITATRTLGAGSQVAWEARVTPASATNPDNPLWGSGVRAGTGLSVEVPADLDGAGEWTNGGSYKAWFRVQQTGAQWSAWVASTAFTISWTPPAAPTSVSGGMLDGILKLTVSGITGRDMLQVDSAPDPAGPWERSVTLPVVGDPQTIDLPLAPYGEPRWYRARASNTVDDVEMWSAWTPALTPITSLDVAARLVAEDRREWIQVVIGKGDRAEDTAATTVTYPLGGDDPIVLRSRSAGWAGDGLALTTRSQAEWQQLIAWLRDHDRWWLRRPPERDTTTSVWVHVPPRLVSMVNPLPDERVFDHQSQARFVPVQWVERKP